MTDALVAMRTFVRFCSKCILFSVTTAGLLGIRAAWSILKPRFIRPKGCWSKGRSACINARIQDIFCKDLRYQLTMSVNVDYYVVSKGDVQVDRAN